MGDNSGPGLLAMEKYLAEKRGDPFVIDRKGEQGCTGGFSRYCVQDFSELVWTSEMQILHSSHPIRKTSHDPTQVVLVSNSQILGSKILNPTTSLSMTDIFKPFKINHIKHHLLLQPRVKGYLSVQTPLYPAREVLL